MELLKMVKRVELRERVVGLVIPPLCTSNLFLLLPSGLGQSLEERVVGLVIPPIFFIYFLQAWGRV